MSCAIAFKSKETGHVIYYTGKAGGDWVSPNRDDAFFGYSPQGAEFIGRKMMRFSPVPADKYELIVLRKDEPALATCESEGGQID